MCASCGELMVGCIGEELVVLPTNCKVLEGMTMVASGDELVGMDVQVDSVAKEGWIMGRAVAVSIRAEWGWVVAGVRCSSRLSLCLPARLF